MLRFARLGCHITVGKYCDVLAADRRCSGGIVSLARRRCGLGHLRCAAALAGVGGAHWGAHAMAANYGSLRSRGGRQLHVTGSGLGEGAQARHGRQNADTLGPAAVIRQRAPGSGPSRVRGSYSTLSSSSSHGTSASIPASPPARPDSPPGIPPTALQIPVPS